MNSEFQSAYERWLDHVDEGDRALLATLAEDPKALRDAFYRDLAFGTGGMRGVIGMGPNMLNRYTVARATQGLAEWILARRASGEDVGSSVVSDPLGRPLVAIARDSRRQGSEFVRTVAGVLAANGIRSVLFEQPEPTPACSFAVRDLGCAAGVVITASHNPAKYNGYKVYGPDGCQITTEFAREIQARIDAADFFEDVRAMTFERAIDDGFASWMPVGVLGRYVSAILSESRGVDCSDLRVAYSPLNGTGLSCMERVLSGVGVSRTAGNLFVVPEQADPDGEFPTCPKPNPEVPEALELLESLMEREGCDLAFATDPDADRLGVVCRSADGRLRALTGNELGVLLLDWLCQREDASGRSLTGRVAVTTVVSSVLSDAVAERWGIELRRTLTGFKFAGEQISLLEHEGREDAFLFGLEESYGCLAGTYVRDKDGLEAGMFACQMAAFLKTRGKSLSDALDELYETYGHCSEEHVSVELPGAEGAARIASVMSALRAEPPASIAGCAVERVIDYLPGAPMPVVNPAAGEEPQMLPPSNVLEFRLSGGSRVLVRPSGTEPKVKAYVFAKGADKAGADALLARLVEVVRGMLVAS